MSVNVKVFDTQHKRVIDMINNLASSMEHHKGSDAVSKTVDELLEYVVVHFSAEEVYFDRFMFADSKAHEKQHKFFVKKIAGMKDSLHAGGTVLSGDLLLFLKDWWINHIMIKDKMYSEYFNDRGVF
jgi:hemerythrin-like metal-binding protein